MKKLLATIAAVALLTTTVHASSFQQNVENSSQIFSERFTAPTWLLEDCKATPGSKIVLKSKVYNLTFYSEEITNITDKLRYTMPLKLNEDKTLAAEYNNWVGVDTPKLAFTFASEAELPGKTHITINDTNLAPYSSVHLYKRTAFYKYLPIASELKVDADGTVTVPVTEGGDYLISAGEITEKVNPYDYQRPTLEEVMAGAGFAGSTDFTKKNPSTGANL